MTNADQSQWSIDSDFGKLSNERRSKNQQLANDIFEWLSLVFSALIIINHYTLTGELHHGPAFRCFLSRSKVAGPTERWGRHRMALIAIRNGERRAKLWFNDGLMILYDSLMMV